MKRSHLRIRKQISSKQASIAYNIQRKYCVALLRNTAKGCCANIDKKDVVKQKGFQSAALLKMLPLLLFLEEFGLDIKE